MRAFLTATGATILAFFLYVGGVACQVVSADMSETGKSVAADWQVPIHIALHSPSFWMLLIVVFILVYWRFSIRGTLHRYDR